MTVNEFIDKMEPYYDAYYKYAEGFDNYDDVVAVIDLVFAFYEQYKGMPYLAAIAWR